MDWQMLWNILPTVVTLILGALAFWLNSQKDLRLVKEKLAQIIGDVIANVVAAARGEMANVTDEMIIAEAGYMYDRLTDLLPDKIAQMVMMIYSKQEFAQLVLDAWRNWQRRTMIVGRAGAVGLS